jgi:hypothetical protein
VDPEPERCYEIRTKTPKKPTGTMRKRNLNRTSAKFSCLVGLLIFLPSGALSENRVTDNTNKVKVEKAKTVYFFEMKEEDRNAFLNNLEKIKTRDERSVVIKILGRPNYDQKLVDKKGIFKARMLKYYLKKREENLVNEKYDELVSPNSTKLTNLSELHRMLNN